MILPIRCFTCDKVIGNKYNKYLELVTEYNTDGDIEYDLNSQAKALDDMKILNYCCRSMFMSHVNIINDLQLYPEIPINVIIKIEEE